MSDWEDLEELWSKNPRLRTWLTTQEAAFPGWVAETGQEWDFSTRSLQSLALWIRGRFASAEQVRAQREDPAVAVPAWYLGEVKNRHAGTIWQCRPNLDPEVSSDPFVITPITEAQLVRLEQCGELSDEEDHRPSWHPIDELIEVARRDREHHL
ncbi:hypothetical protein [Actinoplanes regularis]|uniref:hypothetical protein n=1 Tax=Actinoplanes regularis TaxID=52697 RepID=UPI0024A43899|nr:hypothetical protein [Actinoplanes regularis]GLW34640.1 hypothetical protein Areg01_75770 [Actinoplanes regularis]